VETEIKFGYWRDVMGLLWWGRMIRRSKELVFDLDLDLDLNLVEERQPA
jgi:hypothetical protein